MLELTIVNQGANGRPAIECGQALAASLPPHARPPRSDGCRGLRRTTGLPVLQTQQAG